MPIYEYECRECGHRVELLQGFDGRAPARCEQCGARGTMERLIGHAAAIFKGAGFHTTDYGRSGNGSQPAARSGEGVDTDGEAAGLGGCACGGSCACKSDS